jgi:hypothetical protein
MADGFSGRKGWAQSRLGTDSYNISVVEVVTPSRVIRPGTSRSPARKLLPGTIDGRKEL